MRALSLRSAVVSSRVTFVPKRAFSEDSSASSPKSSGVFRATVIGNVGADPKIIRTADSSAAFFSLAVNSVYRNRDGQLEQKTDWAQIVTRGQSNVDLVERIVKKGAQVFVEGAVETRPTEGGGRSYSVRLTNNGSLRVLRWPRDEEQQQQEGGQQGGAGGKGQVFGEPGGHVYD